MSNKDWWKSAVFYQIYPRSFQDSNNDGIGDLAGITEGLDYLNNGRGGGLGIDALWISPFFKSPMADFGYDVSDYCDVDPIFGTLHDFDQLIEAAHARGIKVVLDLVLNHSSDQHPWFQESRQSRGNSKADWYVWVDPKPDGALPNNWLSVFGGPAWTFEESRGQYYMHSFLKEQPDLNWYNPEVRAAIAEVVRFWMNRGADGFRLDTANFYAYDVELRDNPPRLSDSPILELDKAANPYLRDFLTTYSKDRPENFGFVKFLRDLFDEGEAMTSIGETGGFPDLETAVRVAADYAKGPDRLHMAYGFALLSDRAGSPDYLTEVVQLTEENADGAWPCWSLGNHDCTRLFSRLNCDSKPGCQAMLLSLMLCLRGTPILYYGDELDMPEYPITREELQDPYGINYWPDFIGRDGCRTPFPWSSTAPQQGFNDGARPWLPAKAPLALDAAEQDPNSTLHVLREMIRIRQKLPVLQTGNFQLLESNESVFIFQRETSEALVWVAANLSATEQVIDLTDSDLEDMTPRTLRQRGALRAGTLVIPPYGLFIGLKA
jgi:alpha-glucosidase